MYMLLHPNQYQPNIGIYVIDIHQEVYQVEDSADAVAAALPPSFKVAVEAVEAVVAVAAAAGDGGDISPNLCMKMNLLLWLLATLFSLQV